MSGCRVMRVRSCPRDCGVMGRSSKVRVREERVGKGVRTVGTEEERDAREVERRLRAVRAVREDQWGERRAKASRGVGARKVR